MRSAGTVQISLQVKNSLEEVAEMTPKRTWMFVSLQQGNLCLVRGWMSLLNYPALGRRWFLDKLRTPRHDPGTLWHCPALTALPKVMLTPWLCSG